MTDRIDIDKDGKQRVYLDDGSVVYIWWPVLPQGYDYK